MEGHIQEYMDGKIGLDVFGGKKRPLRWVDREEGWVRQELWGCIQSKYIVRHSQRTNKLENFKIHLKYTQNKM